MQASTRLQPQKGVVDPSVRAELQPHAVCAPPDLNFFALLSHGSDAHTLGRGTAAQAPYQWDLSSLETGSLCTFSLMK